MQIISNDTFDLMKNGEYTEVEIGVSPVMGDSVILTNSNIIAGSFSIDRNSISGNEIEIGNSETTEVKFTIDNADKEFSLRFEGAELYIVFKINNETIPAGYFIVDEVIKQFDTIDIVALDFMAKFNKTYVKQMDGQTTLMSFLTYVCQQCNVTLFNTSFPNSDMIITIPDEEDGLTYHSLVGLIAEIAGLNAYISFDGQLHLNWYGQNYPTVTVDSYINEDGNMVINWNGAEDFSESDTEVTSSGGLAITLTGEIESSVNDLSIENDGILQMNWSGQLYSSKSLGITESDRFNNSEQENEIEITGIVAYIGDEEYIIGTDEYALTISDNLLLTEDNVDSVLNVIFQNISGFTFTPYKFDVHGFPHVWPMDRLIIVNPQGQLYTSYVMRHKYVLNGGSSLSGEANSETVKGYASQSPFTARQRQIIRKTSDAIAEQKMTNYQQSIFEFNKLMTNSMGYYETIAENEETGAIIRYVHDDPLLENSTNIYRQTELGFAYTNEGWQGGDPVWLTGMTADGNILGKVLNVIGINAEWIRAGKITLSQLGETIIDGGKIKTDLLDASRIQTGDLTVGGNGGVGEIRVEDEFNNTLARIDDTGIYSRDIIRARGFSDGEEYDPFQWHTAAYFETEEFRVEARRMWYDLYLFRAWYTTVHGDANGTVNWQTSGLVLNINYMLRLMKENPITGRTGYALEMYGDIIPQHDNSSRLGGTGRRWESVWAVNGTIQSSGKDEKENIKYLSDDKDLSEDVEKLLDVISDKLCVYNYKNDLKEISQENVQLGVLADDVEDCEAFKYIGTVEETEDGKKVYGLQHLPVAMLAVKGYKKLNNKLNKQQEEIDELKKIISEMRK